MKWQTGLGRTTELWSEGNRSLVNIRAGDSSFCPPPYTQLFTETSPRERHTQTGAAEPHVAKLAAGRNQRKELGHLPSAASSPRVDQEPFAASQALLPTAKQTSDKLSLHKTLETHQERRFKGAAGGGGAGGGGREGEKKC
ncbi:hypothetical protein scyTo_0001935 [Scyliorhinus torazame]|uniref:Uncharacterized protein n=1 Tax=Scyliorhinus torazame TaxID=75743 RepID=A0A401PGR3_SCYTO|nr:hypothetical protein [Scyliorhinus torazame]